MYVLQMNVNVCSNGLSSSHSTVKSPYGLGRPAFPQTPARISAAKSHVVWALAYPRTLQRQGRVVRAGSSVVQGPTKLSVQENNVSERAVMYLGSDADVAGRTLFLHLRPGVTVGQVVAVCNELAGRVQDGQCQRFKGTTRPVSFTTPSARVDWDPANEELPAHMGTLLGAEVHSLKLSMISVTVESKAELDNIRRHLVDTVNYIESIDFDRIPLSGSI